MAILGLSTGYADMRKRLGKIVIGRNTDGVDINSENIDVAGAMAVILKDAIKPTLMQTTENTPVIVHTGPFGNIAHGASSIIADQIALRLADYVVTEAGFGADMGAEKFFNIKCRVSSDYPDAAVIVVTTRALKMHGSGIPLKAGPNIDPIFTEENSDLVEKGLPNLAKMIEIVNKHGVPAVVAINRFIGDSDAEIALIKKRAVELGALRAEVSDVHSRGGEGGIELAEAVKEAAEIGSSFKHLYPLSMSIREKIEILAKEIYGAERVKFYDEAEKLMRSYTDRGYGDLPICMAKTQYSLSHDPSLKNRPEGYIFTVRSLKVSVGAGFLIPLAGDILMMPGLPAHPALKDIELTDEGEVVGLF